MILTVFRSRRRPEHREEYERRAARMNELASRMPGFISIKTFTADDGERVSLVEFESEDTMRAWREHPEHKQAQELGRKLFYSMYRIQVCPVLREYSFPKKADGPHPLA